MDAFTELRQLADDLTELGDTATPALVHKVTEKFMACKFEAEQLLEKALAERRKHEHESPRNPILAPSQGTAPPQAPP